MNFLPSKVIGGTFFFSFFAMANAAEFTVQPVAEATLGIFNSEKSYNGENGTASHTAWQELSLKYGIKGNATFDNNQLYGRLTGISSATFGDGDAGQNTNGKERKTDVNEWIVGFKDGTQSDGFDTYDLSLGRQNILIGDGFFIAGDALNLGKPPADGALNRGGAYYLAARRSFDFTTLLQYKLFDTTTAKFAYLESDNKAQYSPHLFVADLMHQQEDKGIGLTYLDVLDIDDAEHLSGREHLKNYAVRMNYKPTSELQLKSEFVLQDKHSGHENAGYASLEYSFLTTPYTPTVGYRFSHFSDQYDPMFYGNTTGFGTWFQGEVAGNYAGPFNTNADIHQLSFSMNLSEKLILGALAYKFKTVDKSEQNLDGHELDVYSLWFLNKNLTVIPLVGLYKPKKDIHATGTQNYDSGHNFYSQLILQYSY